MKKLFGWFLALLSVIGFASTFIFGAALTKDCGVSPVVLSLMRFTIAGSVMLAVELSTHRGRAKLLSVSRKDWIRMAWLGPVGTTIMAWCVFMGCARVSAANASMADALTPLMIFVVAAIKAWHVEFRQLVALGCGLLGALLVIQIVHAHGIALEAYTIGDVFILLAAATWGVYTVYGHDQIERLGSSAFTAWTMLIGAAFLGLVMLLAHLLSPNAPVSGGFDYSIIRGFDYSSLVWPTTFNAWLLVVALGLISTLLPFWTWNAAQKYLPMSVLSITAYFTPVFAIAMAMMFLHESTTILQWLGTALIVASAFVETGSCKMKMWYNNRKCKSMELDASLIGKEFVHFKGGHYRLVGYAKDSETQEPMCVYEALYGDSPSLTSFGVTRGGLWVRPAKMFFEHVDKPGYSGPRFRVF